MYHGRPWHGDFRSSDVPSAFKLQLLVVLLVLVLRTTGHRDYASGKINLKLSATLEFNINSNVLPRD